MQFAEIICLANSRKLNGRCVAGKRTQGHAWARPLSPLTRTGELTLRDVTYADWTEVKVLDILRIPFARNTPKPHHPEDFEMGKGVCVKMGSFDIAGIDKLCDNSQDIWLCGTDIDRIASEPLALSGLSSSLMLIKPEQGASLINETSYGKYRLKCSFAYNGMHYNFSVTDPVYEREYKSKASGCYKLPDSGVYLCISVGEPFNGFCYKLVATIFTSDCALR